MTPADEMRAAATKVREFSDCFDGAAEKIAAILDEAADRWDSEIARDIPDCPACGEGCGGHTESLYHDGDSGRAGCERPFLDGTTALDRCVCFEAVLDAARAINGPRTQGASS